MNERRSHRPRPRRVTTLVLALAIAAMLALGGMATIRSDGVASRAQQPGSPAAGTTAVVGLPVVPAAAECAVAPVPFAGLPAVPPANPATGTPAPPLPTGGSPATPEQAAAVLATLRLQVACVNAGDVPRALALTGGAYREEILAEVGTPSEAEYAVLATPLPRTDGTLIAITALDGTMSLPDGSLTAQVTTLATATTVNAVTLSPSSTSPTSYVITGQEQVSRAVPTRTPIA